MNQNLKTSLKHEFVGICIVVVLILILGYFFPKTWLRSIAAAGTLAIYFFSDIVYRALVTQKISKFLDFIISAMLMTGALAIMFVIFFYTNPEFAWFHLERYAPMGYAMVFVRVLFKPSRFGTK